MQNTSIWKKSGIRRVTYYVASGPVETCDCCSAGIRNVALVEYADGARQRFGSSCINKILAQTPSMKTLFAKRSRLLKHWQACLEALERPLDQIPRGSEYYGSGLYFVGVDGTCDICCGKVGRPEQAGGCYIFHPLPDWDKNQSGDKYVQKQSFEEYQAEQIADIETRKPWLRDQIAKLEKFLAAVLAKAAREEVSK